MIHVHVPSPMPDVARAQVYVPDAIVALARAKSAWNKTQMLDAIRSTETFLEAAKVVLGVVPPGAETEAQHLLMAATAVPNLGELFAAVGGFMNGGPLGYPSFGSMDALRIFAQRSIRAGIAAASLIQVQPSEAAHDVLTERRRQVDAMGYDKEHDDEHQNDEIGAYAALYAMPPGARDWPATETGYGATFGEAILPSGWSAPKTGDRRRELVKAGALVLAEIERLDRAAKEGGAA